MSLNPYVEISGSGPNLVLLHGWGLHGGIWQTVLPLLEQHFTVHNIDLPGFGRSAVYNGDYDLSYLVDSVNQVLPQQCYLMGWSLGGLVATAVAKKHPNKVKKLITVASSPRFIAAEDWPYGMDPLVLKSFMEYLSDDFEGTLIKFLSIQTMGSKTQKQDVAQLKNTVFIHGLPAKKALTGGLQILQDTNLLEDLANLSTPLLRIYGKLDTLVPVKSAKLVSDIVPESASMIFNQSGHAPFLSESENFTNTVAEFLLQIVPCIRSRVLEKL